MVREGSLLSKVTAGVTIFVVISMLGFGLKLYAGQQDRYTGSQAKDDRAAVLEYVSENYTTKELSSVRFQSIIDRLERIEKKIDRAEREK
jgi:hypothetical protein